MNEYRITELFEVCCEEYVDIEFVHRETGTACKHMDIEYIFKNFETKQKEYVRLEVKNLIDPRNNSQKFLNAIGAILRGRNVPTAAQTGLPVVYGLLFLEKHEGEALAAVRNIATVDWGRMQQVFDCHYVVFFDEEKNEISYYEWMDFRNHSLALELKNAQKSVKREPVRRQYKGSVKVE